MKVGDIVKHNHSGESMRIVRYTEGETVATCELLAGEPEWNTHLNEMRLPRAVCSIDNLTITIEDNQLSLFLNL